VVGASVERSGTLVERHEMRLEVLMEQGLGRRHAPPSGMQGFDSSSYVPLSQILYTIDHATSPNLCVIFKHDISVDVEGDTLSGICEP
jgi:hypothetical protein